MVHLHDWVDRISQMLKASGFIVSKADGLIVSKLLRAVSLWPSLKHFPAGNIVGTKLGRLQAAWELRQGYKTYNKGKGLRNDD
jgi:hypothetical protein